MDYTLCWHWIQSFNPRRVPYFDWNRPFKYFQGALTSKSPRFFRKEWKQRARENTDFVIISGAEGRGYKQLSYCHRHVLEAVARGVQLLGDGSEVELDLDGEMVENILRILYVGQFTSVRSATKNQRRLIRLVEELDLVPSRLLVIRNYIRSEFHRLVSHPSFLDLTEAQVTWYLHEDSLPLHTILDLNLITTALLRWSGGANSLPRRFAICHDPVGASAATPARSVRSSEHFATLNTRSFDARALVGLLNRMAACVERVHGTLRVTRHTLADYARQSAASRSQARGVTPHDQASPRRYGDGDKHADSINYRFQRPGTVGRKLVLRSLDGVRFECDEAVLCRIAYFASLVRGGFRESITRQSGVDRQHRCATDAVGVSLHSFMLRIVIDTLTSGRLSPLVGVDSILEVHTLFDYLQSDELLDALDRHLESRLFALLTDRPPDDNELRDAAGGEPRSNGDAATLPADASLPTHGGEDGGGGGGGAGRQPAIHREPRDSSRELLGQLSPGLMRRVFPGFMTNVCVAFGPQGYAFALRSLLQWVEMDASREDWLSDVLAHGVQTTAREMDSKPVVYESFEGRVCVFDGHRWAPCHWGDFDSKREGIYNFKMLRYKELYLSHNFLHSNTISVQGSVDDSEVILTCHDKGRTGYFTEMFGQAVCSVGRRHFVVSIDPLFLTEVNLPTSADGWPLEPRCVDPLNRRVYFDTERVLIGVQLDADFRVTERMEYASERITRDHHLHVINGHLVAVRLGHECFALDVRSAQFLPLAAFAESPLAGQPCATCADRAPSTAVSRPEAAAVTSRHCWLAVARLAPNIDGVIYKLFDLDGTTYLIVTEAAELTQARLRISETESDPRVAGFFQWSSLDHRWLDVMSETHVPRAQIQPTVVLNHPGAPLHTARSYGVS